MGDRKCEFDGCNALEFRTSGYCLRHKGGSPDEKTPVITSTPEKDSRKPVTEDWRIPFLALGYVPFVIILSIFSLLSDDPFDGFYLFLYSGMCLVVLLPIYAVYLARTTWQRFKNGTLTKSVAIFYVLSFIVPLVWFLMFVVFAVNFNGIV